MASETTDFNPGTKGNPKSFTVNPVAGKGEPIDESTGPVTQDSLAAESVRAGGGFADNANPQVLDVRGSQSTLNNTDTSNAKVLHAAGNREERDIGENVSQTKYPEQAGAPGFTGTMSQEGYAGAPTSDSSSSSTTAAQSTGTGSHTYSHPSSTAAATATATGTGARPYVPTAPNYAATTAGNIRTQGELEPKGDDLRENEDIAPNKTTFTGAVGGPNDPGRLAEQSYTKLEGAVGASGGVRDNATSADGENVYENLRSSERA